MRMPWLVAEICLLRRLSSVHGHCDHIPFCLELIEEVDHGLTLLRVRKRTKAGTDIVGEVSGICGARNHRCDSFVTKQKFQKELRPGRCTEFVSPFRYAPASHRVENRVAAEGERRQYGGADILSCGQQTVFSGPIGQRIIDLEEVWFLPPNDRFSGTIVILERCRDPNVAA